MVKKKKQTKATRRTGNSSNRTPKALTMLEKDHKLVSSMFRQYERSSDDDEKQEILQRVCAALTAHAQLEEELFYPALREAFGEDDHELLDEATVEHDVVKTLIGQLEDAEAGDEMVGAKVKVLSEYVKHHVQEEEDEIFPKAKRAKDLDLDELATRMEARKVEIEAELGLGDDEIPATSPRRGRARRVPVGARD